MLRPNKGEGLESSKQDSTSTMFIKNGMNPNKLFTQVHYIKGYFLLRWLEQEIGLEGMQSLLHAYIVKYHGQMVTSKDFLKLAFHNFPHLGNIHSIDGVCSDWLDGAGIPTKLKNFAPSASNVFYRTVLDQFTLWEKLDRSLKRLKSTAKRRKLQCEFCALNSHQLHLLLDKLLEKSSLCISTLTRLNQQYNFNKTNAEIQHRWFELVVKHKYTHAYSELGSYLVKHQAMGVYLYGEMIIAKCRKLQAIAQESFGEVQCGMEPNTREIVHKMLYGL
jgi:aminopeptidase O